MGFIPLSHDAHKPDRGRGPIVERAGDGPVLRWPAVRGTKTAMAMARHAEVAGAGFGGLVAAVALAGRGWSVRLHERQPALRAEGFGIAIMPNVARLFRALGLHARIVLGGIRIDHWEHQNGNGRRLVPVVDLHDSFRISRHHIIATLAACAHRLGVEIVTASSVVAVDPEGAVVLEGGRRWPADLVVVADGINSAMPEMLGLRRRRLPQGEGGVRMTIPRLPEDVARDIERGTRLTEAWAAGRRLLWCPNTEDTLYAILTCPTSDVSGRATPLDTAAWTATFPALAPLLARIRDHTDWSHCRWAEFETVILPRWSAGRVAILGDAAHAMTPYLGQGAGTAMMNALSLAVHLDRYLDTERALAAWEATERPHTEHTQRWSRHYGWTLAMPDPLKPLWLRAKRLPPLARRFGATARRVPTGC
ncbi:MAG: FAD-dependent monooxygenase [Alphaproteobacteria bacterium]|nr:FAD-dependent monooxygenase [Alphaproteobacteria bacterium]